jgi:hypothetical protein
MNEFEESFVFSMRDFADALIAYYKSEAPEDTGALRNSIRAEVKPDGEISIIYLRYGAYQDLGVRGVVSSDKAPNSPFQFKDKRTRFGALSPVGGNLSYGARVNIRKLGLSAQNWLTSPNGEVKIPNVALNALEESLSLNITNTTQRAVNNLI